MAFKIDHTIVPSHNKEEAAKFIGRMFGIKYTGANGHFAPLQVSDSITLDFDNRDTFESHHYAFRVNDEDFDATLARIQAENIVYGSLPTSQDDMQINTRRGGRGFYFRDRDGHSWELLTK